MADKENQSEFREGSLVLYKHDPARVRSVGRKKLTIVLSDGDTLRVRPKDIELLHPGPVESLDQLVPPAGEMKTAWELLSGGETTLRELTELAYGAYTPAAAWAAWQWVADALYFEGTPQHVVARTTDAVSEEKARREARAAERRAWDEFLGRARSGHTAPDDARYLTEVERLALGQTDQSRVLSELGRAETPENAHALLLQLDYWDHTVVPYPDRLGLPTSPPAIALPDLPDEPRRDLTHLLAFAIDDQGSSDPDDAVSLETTAYGRRLWVHVADAAAVAPADSAVDLEARARGATLYLPDGKVPMLPPEAALRLGMGLNPVSPALSFSLDLGDDGEVTRVEIVPSLVSVTRLTYEQAEAHLEEEPLRSLYRLAHDFQAYRQEKGAVRIEIPEVSVRVIDHRVIIRPLLPLRSRALVQEAMLVAGQAAARFAREEDIPMPYATQPPPDADERPEDLAGMFALIRRMSRSEYRTVPGRHAGLGLDRYVQATSPLRRYLDLVVHQQFRAHLEGTGLLSTSDLMERIGAAEAVAGSVSRAERLAEEHWTLVYLSQHPDWQGEAVLVDKWDRRGRLLIPELGLESQMQLHQDWSLNTAVQLEVLDVELPRLQATFRPL